MHLSESLFEIERAALESVFLFEMIALGVFLWTCLNQRGFSHCLTSKVLKVNRRLSEISLSPAFKRLPEKQAYRHKRGPATWGIWDQTDSRLSRSSFILNHLINPVWSQITGLTLIIKFETSSQNFSSRGSNSVWAAGTRSSHQRRGFGELTGQIYCFFKVTGGKRPQQDFQIQT